MYEMLYFWPTQGSGLMLTTLAAVFVGGTSVFGGKGLSMEPLLEYLSLVLLNLE